MRIPSVLAACLSVVQLAAAQSLEPKVYDLGVFVRPHDPRLAVDEPEPFVVPWAMSLPMGWDVDEASEHVGATRVTGALGRGADPEAVLGWLVDALHVGGEPGTLRVGTVVDPGRALVEATAASHGRLARRIAELEAAALRPIAVELWRLPAEAFDHLPPGGVLDDAAVDALFARHAPLGLWRRDTRTGVSIVLRAGESRSYMRDVEVEVASEQEVVDPKMDVMHFGLLATIRVARGPRGGAFLACALRRTDESPDSRTIETEYAEIQLPSVDVELHESRTYIPSDGAVVLGASAARGSVWVVRVRGLGGVRPDAVPLGGVGELPWRPFAPGRVGQRPLSIPGEEFFVDDGSSSPAPLPVELVEAIAQHDQTAEVPGLVIGDSWVAARESAALGRVRALAVAHAAGRSFAVRYALRLADAAETARLLGAGADLDSAAAQAPVRGVLTTREGDLAAAFIGTEHAYLRDHDVEIAQGASVANPIPDSWLDGAAIRLEVHSGADERLHVRGDVGLQLTAEGPQQLPEGAYDRGPLDAPRVDHARVEVDRELGAGSWQLAELAPFGRAGRHLVVLIRVDG